MRIAMLTLLAGVAAVGSARAQGGNAGPPFTTWEQQEADSGGRTVYVRNNTKQPITIEAARPQIVRFLTYDQIRDLLEKLRGRAKVEVMVKTDTPSHAVPPADAPKTGAVPALIPPPAPLKGGQK